MWEREDGGNMWNEWRMTALEKSWRKIAHVAHGAEGGLKKDGKMSYQETNVFILFFFLLEEQAKAYRGDKEEDKYKIQDVQNLK